MTAYRFRIKFDPDPTSLWRDIVVGGDRTLDEFQSAIDEELGPDPGQFEEAHFWFFGADERYWNSDVLYQCPQEFDTTASGGSATLGQVTYNAAETTVGEMVRQFGLQQYDRICYLYDYSNEWRFYGILKAVLDDAPDDTPPEVGKKKGDPAERYPAFREERDSPDPSGYAHGRAASGDTTPLPAPLDELPDTAVPTADLRALENRDDVVHVIVLLSIETGFGTVSERFLIQYEDAGYILENYQPGWKVVEYIDGTDTTEEELLAALASAAREWHAEIAEMAGAATGQYFDEDTVEAMNVELDAALERKGYDQL